MFHSNVKSLRKTTKEQRMAFYAQAKHMYHMPKPYPQLGYSNEIDHEALKPWLFTAMTIIVPNLDFKALYDNKQLIMQDVFEFLAHPFDGCIRTSDTEQHIRIIKDLHICFEQIISELNRKKPLDNLARRPVLGARL
jgi:hypothetical protein